MPAISITCESNLTVVCAAPIEQGPGGRPRRGLAHQANCCDLVVSIRPLLCLRLVLLAVLLRHLLVPVLEHRAVSRIAS
jgi:hypothetical protein